MKFKTKKGSTFEIRKATKKEFVASLISIVIIAAIVLLVIMLIK